MYVYTIKIWFNGIFPPLMMCHGGPNQWSSWANLYTGFKFTGLDISAVTLFFFLDKIIV